MFFSINIYSQKIGEIENFLQSYYDCKIKIENKLFWNKNFSSPFEIIDMISIFIDNIDVSLKKKINDEVIKFVKGAYQRQLLENIDFKILVKDTTLANSAKEHAERHLFTLANSRLFKQEEN